MELVMGRKGFVGLMPVLDASQSVLLSINRRRPKDGRTKRARCLAMHSSYNSGDHGENLTFAFEAFSNISGGATSPRMSL